MTIRAARFPGELEVVRGLLREYQHSVDAAVCFTTFEKELAALPGDYVALLVAEDERGLAGTAALRPLGDGVCEMKRLYVRPRARGANLGRALTEAIVAEGRARGYSALRLDTLPIMDRAIALYRSLGFREIAPYSDHPFPGALFFEITL